MSRLFAAALLGLAIPAAARAADPEAAPEKLLSPTSQLYVRWDGVTAHAETYKKSFWGPLMAGPSGDSLRALLAKVPKLLGNNLLADPLLDGRPPAELKATLADLKNASKLIDLIADKGVVVGAEVRGPKPSIKAIGSALGGLLGGSGPSPEAFMPEVQLLVIIPDVGNQAEVLFATLRLATPNFGYSAEPFTVGNRKGFRLAPGEKKAAPAVGTRRLSNVSEAVPPQPLQAPPPEAAPEGFQIQGAWWVEGKHFVLYLGTMKPEAVVAEVAANAEKGGVTAHPLFARCTAKPAFDSVARGFADAGSVVSLAKSLLGPFVPGLNLRLDELGFGNLKAILFNAGYDGREFRAVWEVDLPGERKGLAKILKREPLGLADLPPMPTDVSRFVGMRIDPAATYEAGLGLIEAIGMGESFGAEDDAKTPAEKIRLRREYLAREFDKVIGLSVKGDILPCLGDKVVVYQSPNEGLSVFGTVVCISLKDPAKAKALAERVHNGLETLISAPIKVRKKTLRGVEIRELYSRGFGFVVPSYAVVDDWLVVSVHPQGAQGFILRKKGDLPAWKPNADVLARLAKLPKDGCTVQYCDPTTTVKNLCCLGPLVLGAIGLQGNFGNDNNSDFDPIDIGLIPNGHELSKHLFPNLTVIRDDGKTVRLEVSESLSAPLEVFGLEVLFFAGFLGFAF
jgi:hypothetical protein